VLFTLLSLGFVHGYIGVHKVFPSVTSNGNNTIVKVNVT